MQDDYFSFLDTRAAQRRLGAKFSRPHGLMLHTLAFITAMTVILAYGTAWNLWVYRENFVLPTLVGAIWSLLLALHGLRHYRRSSAIVERRELAVEEEMRQWIEKSASRGDDESLFATHRRLDADLQRQGRWSLALMGFAVVNAVSWVISAFNMGTSWGFQMTLPLAVVIIGGISAFVSWQQRRQDGRSDWFTRLPLRHIAAYGVGLIVLILMGSYHAINPWDADTLIEGWCIVLLLHILLSVAVLPLIQRFLPAKRKAKAKPAARLVLGDDGEVLEVIDQDAQHYQTNTL